MPSEPPPHQTARTRLSLSAALVAGGMVLTRLSGLVRTILFSRAFGVTSDAADAFTVAVRIPNFLQNLLGEGVLSASLIPVYSGLMVTSREEADRVARLTLGVLALITAVTVLLGMTFTPAIVSLTAGGYTGAKRELTIALVRIMFPGVGLLVMSAWCLAILNSHHRFFLSYAAPVVWNAAQITVLVVFWRDPLPHLAWRLAWATVAGAGLQVAVQAPTVWRLMRDHWRRTALTVGLHVRRVLVTSIPVVFTRGVVQISAFIDSYLATWLGTGAATALLNAQQLSQLPISLFGMAIASASLPTMSTAVASNLTATLRSRLVEGQRAIVALVVPSMVAFLVFGDVMIALLLEHGKFTHANTLYVWGVLAGSAVGLMATTVGRLYSSAFYAFGDTTTPTRIAFLRVLLVGALGYVLALPMPRWIGVPQTWGAAGLTASAGMAGWIEFLLLRRALRGRLGSVTIPARTIGHAWLIAGTAALVASPLRWVLPSHLHIVRGFVILGTFGLVYLAGAQRTGLLDVAAIARRVLRRRG